MHTFPRCQYTRTWSHTLAISSQNDSAHLFSKSVASLTEIFFHSVPRQALLHFAFLPFDQAGLLAPSARHYGASMCILHARIRKFDAKRNSKHADMKLTSPEPPSNPAVRRVYNRSHASEVDAAHIVGIEPITAVLAALPVHPDIVRPLLSPWIHRSDLVDGTPVAFPHALALAFSQAMEWSLTFQIASLGGRGGSAGMRAADGNRLGQQHCLHDRPPRRSSLICFSLPRFFLTQMGQN